MNDPHRLLAALAAAACASCVSSGEAVRASRAFPQEIAWPDEYRPEDASFFVHNSIEVAAPAEVVWDLLIEAESWPNWYEGATDVEVIGDTGALSPGTVFTWKTMGLSFTSTVREFAPPHRLSWESTKAVIRGYHAWLIIPTETGCTVVTDESQHGLLTVLERIFQPNKLRRLHDVWLREIRTLAEARTAMR